jgi:N-acetylglucosamine-6-phosphate deacetylase
VNVEWWAAALDASSALNIKMETPRLAAARCGAQSAEFSKKPEKNTISTKVSQSKQRKMSKFI